MLLVLFIPLMITTVEAADLSGGPASISEVLGGPAPDQPAAAPLEPAPSLEPVTITSHLLAVRYWSNQDYTRIVIDLDRPAPYQPPHLLRPDPELGTPPRLYIDFAGVALSEQFKREMTNREGCYHLPIGDGLLRKARVAQYRPDVVRVVLDIERIERFHGFALPGDAFRYVIDVYGVTPPHQRASQLAKTDPPARTRPDRIPPPPSRSAGPSVLVVLDAGHGGKDPGAVGPSGTREKDLTLSLVHRVNKALQRMRPGTRVILTRSDDRYLTLVERTAKANTLNADLFVSVHINAAPNRKAQGIETYYLDNTTDHASLRLAAKENFVSEQQMVAKNDTTNLILADMITSSKVEDSVPLARYLQQAMVRGIGRKYSDTKDLGVKKAPFWVLTGATMPCALVEVNFVSNPQVEKRLRTADYQETAAQAIAAGIAEYINKYHLVSMNR